MKRRNFIKSLPVVAAPAMVNGFEVKALSPSHWFSSLAALTTETDHVFVIVQLNGGNDGLNTVIPLDQYSNLSKARPNILIPESKVLKLNGTDKTGLHPAMTGLQTMFNEGELSIVQGVGYPAFNYSHFRATDIWLTGADSDETLNSGWVARYMNYEYENFPAGYPNTTMPDPLAIQIGSGGLLPMFQGNGINYGITLANSEADISIGSGFDDPVPGDWSGKELAFIREVQRQADKYGDVIVAASQKVTTQGAYPANNNLASQLKIVARLIAGGLKTRVYHVSIGGFDTHSNQVDATDTSIGTHANLLQGVSDAIKAFNDDLHFLKINQRVSGMVFSEFGRRIKSNASDGTDHGSALPVIFFGHKLQTGFIGNNPTIGSNVSSNDNLTMQFDFRALYAAVLRDWFCVDPDDLEQIQLHPFNPIPVYLQSANCLSTDVHDQNVEAGKSYIKVFPNPVHDRLTIEYSVNGSPALVDILDTQGRSLQVINSGSNQSGEYRSFADVSNLSPGHYSVRYQNGDFIQVRPFIKL